MPNHYPRFALMLTVSFVIMYAAMFTNVDRWDHILLSPTRTYMSLIMVAPMAISMLLFMWSMYPNKKLNWLIIGLAGLVTVGSIFMLRRQVFIQDVAYMQAMIPHHSSAIMVSQQAQLRDPETRELARQIIESQEREIAQMKALIQRLQHEE